MPYLDKDWNAYEVGKRWGTWVIQTKEHGKLVYGSYPTEDKAKAALKSYKEID